MILVEFIFKLASLLCSQRIIKLLCLSFSNLLLVPLVGLFLASTTREIIEERVLGICCSRPRRVLRY